MLATVARAFAEAVLGRFVAREEAPRVTGYHEVRAFRPASSGAAFHTVFRLFRGSRLRYDRREVLGDVVLDWVGEGRGRRGVVVILHGLGASSHSLGVKRIAEEAVDRGFAAVAYNRPGHAEGPGAPLFAGEYPAYTDEEETARVVDHVAKTTALPVYAVGLSAGANTLVKYLGRPESPIKAAVAVANGLDLAKCYSKLGAGFSAFLASRAMRVYARHGNRFRARTLGEFDERVSGTPLAEYHARHSSADALRRTRVPTMCIGAENDPIVHRGILDVHDEIARSNPNVVSVRTKEGGHCGWVTRDRAVKKGRWMESVALDFIERVGG